MRTVCLAAIRGCPTRLEDISVRPDLSHFAAQQCGNVRGNRMRRNPVMDHVVDHPARNTQLAGKLGLRFAEAAQLVNNFDGIHRLVIGGDKLPNHEYYISNLINKFVLAITILL